MIVTTSLSQQIPLTSGTSCVKNMARSQLRWNGWPMGRASIKFLSPALNTLSIYPQICGGFHVLVPQCFTDTFEKQRLRETSASIKLGRVEVSAGRRAVEW
jgi:hypothetical protein